MTAHSSKGFRHFQLSKSSFNVPLSQIVEPQLNSFSTPAHLSVADPEGPHHIAIPAAPSEAEKNQNIFSDRSVSHGRQTQRQTDLFSSQMHDCCGVSRPVDTPTGSVDENPSRNQDFSSKKVTFVQDHSEKVSLFRSSFDMPVSQILKSQKCNGFGRSNSNENPPGSKTGSRHIMIPPAPVYHNPDKRVAVSAVRSQPVIPQGHFQDEPFRKSDNPNIAGVQLRSVEEISRVYQGIFSFPYFNILQSLVFDEVLYTDKSIVASAPTGSGKTVIFELAVIRLLMKTENSGHRGKIVYMSPMKALCSERFQDWSTKFGCHGLTCLEVTGDSELDDIEELVNANLICTTPEKWDSMSRRWKDNKAFFQQIQLFLIDEIHILNDSNRGATVEAVVSRMRTLQTARLSGDRNHMRFVAVSATMPNYNDIAEWLGTSSKPATAFTLGEKFRPVKLDRVVFGYPFKEGTSDFRFDMNLSYRLRAIIDTYSTGKPTLVFCSSRKSVVQSAETLARTMRSHSLLAHYSANILQRAAGTVHENKLAELLQQGIGIHHAGLDNQDRHTIEDLFKSSQLPVLISTSTLAMGVNLPAHLVIIKSTHFYNMGMVQEYSDMQILQMIGRAGRPQFDTSATAVIMTKTTLKAKYESLVNGTQLIESSLHKNLIEHLNAEIVLQTISEMTMVIEWIRHTFLYVRVMRNPKHYGLPSNLSRSEVEQRLKDLCLQDVHQLTGLNLVSLNEETSSIIPTNTGRLMARYCIAFETMKLFYSIPDNQDSIADMLMVVSKCSEFEDIQLRTNEKRILNSLNRDKKRETIRFPMPGKIKLKHMKVNCLIQAQLSCLPVQDFSLSQDMAKIFRVGQRVAKCLMEFIYQGTNNSLLLHAILIYKAFKSKLWFDSRYVARQLDGIGPTMSLALANSGLSSFQKLEQANPRDIELIVNRHPPFGSQIREAVAALPRYELTVEQMKCYKPSKAVLMLSVDLLNRSLLETKPSSHNNHQSILIVGDAENNLVFKWRIVDAAILRAGAWTRTLEVKRSSQGTKLTVCLLSMDWVGLDIQVDYEPVYSEGWFEPVKTPSNTKARTPASKLRSAMESAKSTTSSKSPASSTPAMKKTASECSHHCLDKASCGHKCCKSGPVKHRLPPPSGTGSAKLSKVERPDRRESKDMKEMYGILDQHSLTNNQPRLSMRRDWKIQTADKNPTTEVNTGPNLSKSLWSKETEDRQSHCDALDDFSEDCFSQDDFLDDLENLGSVDGGSRTSGLPKERNIEAADIWNGRSDEGSASDVIILNDMWDSNQAPERNLKAVERDKSHNLSRNPTDISRSKPRLWSGSSENETASLRQVPPTKFTKPSEELNNCNLDIRVNGWADLDAFQRGRQELFQNGRPLELHEDYDDELPSLTNSPESRVKSSYKNFGDRTDSGAWITTTSSDEELCQLVDATVPPANVEMCHQKPFLGTTAVNSHITIGQADRTLDGKNEKRTCKPTVHSSPVLGRPKPFAASRRVHTVTGETTQREGLPKSSHITHDPQCTFDLTGYDSNSYLSSDQESSHCLQHGIASPEVISIDDSNSGASDDHGAPHWKFHPSESPSPIMYAGKISQTVTPTRKVVTPAVAGSTCRDVCVSKSSELIDTHHGDDFRTSQVMNERSSTSARRFGHVRAWKKQSPSSAQVLNSREDIEHPKCTMSKLFVPKGRITGQEIQETGGLFDGIF